MSDTEIRDKVDDSESQKQSRSQSSRGLSSRRTNSESSFKLQSILQVQPEESSKSSEVSEIHRYVEFKKSIKSTRVVICNDKKYKLKGGYEWHPTEDSVKCLDRKAYLHHLVNKYLPCYAYNAIQEGLNNTTEAASTAMSALKELNVFEEFFKQGRDEEVYHASEEIIRRYKRELEKQLEGVEIPERCIANLSDVDFNEVALLDNGQLLLMDKPSEAEGDDQSEASVDETFLKLKEKFGGSIEELEGYNEQMEEVLRRLTRFCNEQDDNRTLEEEDYSDEATLNSEHSLQRYNFYFQEKVPYDEISLKTPTIDKEKCDYI